MTIKEAMKIEYDFYEIQSPTEEDEFQQLFTCQAEPPAIHSAQFDKTFN